MKNLCIIFSLLLFFSSCGTRNNKVDKETALRNQAVEIAVKYASEKNVESKVTTESNGIVTVSDNAGNFILNADNRVKYVIDPAKITTGLINDDQETDAIMIISPSKGQYLLTPEVLILTGKDDKLILNRVIESDMKILQIKEREITAEISTKSRNSPLRDCPVCKEIVKFRFRNGELVKTE
jgi:hypothetical protein